MATADPGRVLSIQSHVAFGYVGNKAAVFPLQCLGFDVDVINTVNFSNHSGYGRLGGSRTTAKDLEQMFKSMEENGFLACSNRLLTGYIPGAEALSCVKTFAEKLVKGRPETIYVLDPVIGDSGKMYVAPDVVPVYRSMLPLSTVITPNWFEVEVLTSIQLSSLSSLRSALAKLHEEFKVPNVVISSLPIKPWLWDCLPAAAKLDLLEEDEKYLLCVASAATSSTEGTSEDIKSIVHIGLVKLLPGYFSGVGDLFSSTLLAHFHHPSQPLTPSSPTSSSPSTPTQTSLSNATALALHKTSGILQLTHEHALTLPEVERLPTDEEKDIADPMRKIMRMRGRELRLIQGQDIIRDITRKGVREMLAWEEFWTL